MIEFFVGYSADINRHCAAMTVKYFMPAVFARIFHCRNRIGASARCGQCQDFSVIIYRISANRNGIHSVNSRKTHCRSIKRSVYRLRTAGRQHQTKRRRYLFSFYFHVYTGCSFLLLRIFRTIKVISGISAAVTICAGSEETALKNPSALTFL